MCTSGSLLLCLQVPFPPRKPRSEELPIGVQNGNCSEVLNQKVYFLLGLQSRTSFLIEKRRNARLASSSCLSQCSPTLPLLFLLPLSVSTDIIGVHIVAASPPFFYVSYKTLGPSYLLLMRYPEAYISCNVSLNHSNCCCTPLQQFFSVLLRQKSSQIYTLGFVLLPEGTGDSHHYWASHTSTFLLRNRVLQQHFRHFAEKARF